MNIKSKLPYVEGHIFSYMSGLANQYNAINLSQGFPNFEPAQELKDLVARSLAENTSQYAPMAGLPALREEIARKAYKCFNISINPDNEITVGCGATEMIFSAIAAFVWPGDEVVIIEPGYDCYRPAIDVAGGTTVVYKMKAPEFKIDWQEFAACITPKTCMICISSPNNPTGSLMDKEDMQALAKLVDSTDIIILSDEVYEHMVFDGAAHQSPLMYAQLKERTISVFSFGKTLHITGWRIGYAIAPEQLTTELRKVHQNAVFSASHLLQKAIAVHLAQNDDYLNLPEFYQKKRDLFLQAMMNTKFKPLHCRGSYFQLFDYSAISDEGDFAFCERLVKEFGVAAIPVSRMYTDRQDDRLIRLCFAKTNDVLIIAAERLGKL